MSQKKETPHASPQYLFDNAQWDYRILQDTYNAIEDIALGELKLDIYPNQIEVITSEQMLDAYSSIGMPLMYNHWSYGKSFVRDETMYRKGFTGLAYEIVINSNPCISYIMEENSMTMQALVMSHAAFGHNHFFKNNHLFQQWTDANAILDYLQFAKNYIAKCEERFGIAAVEQTLDAAHALKDNAVDRYSRPPKLESRKVQERELERLEYEQAQYNDLWRTVPKIMPEEEDRMDPELLDVTQKMGLPESNLLYFLEKQSPRLQGWQRELLRIVRNIAQYFYPQKQTKVMNEGCACFVHYFIMNRLYDKGLIGEGTILEFIDFHTRVVAQPQFDQQGYSGINPYALGFAMMQDIQRICENPTDEDREWFPDIAGSNRAIDVLKDAWANYRDESFILQFLSPKLIRDFRLFSLSDNSELSYLEVDAIHNKRGYKHIRRALAAEYAIGNIDLDIQVTGVDLHGDRTLTLTHTRHNQIPIEQGEAYMVLEHIKALWGYDVRLISIDPKDNKIKQELTTFDGQS